MAEKALILFEGIDHDKQKRYLDALARSGLPVHARRVAGIEKKTVIRWMENPTFANAAEEAREMAVEVLEDECDRRAIRGTEEPIYWRGKKVGSVRKYSDALLMFRLRAMKPHVYRDNAVTVNTGNVLQITIEEPALPQDAAARANLIDAQVVDESSHPMEAAPEAKRLPALPEA